MQSAASSGSSTLTEGALSVAELMTVVRSQAEKITALEHQLDWFRRQFFGQKSERFAPEPDPNQLRLGQAFPATAAPAEEHKTISAHTRRTARQDSAESGEELRFFDESKVPVQTITLLHADLQGIPADQYEVIGEKVSYRIAQRPGAYHVIAYHRPVVKLKATGRILGLPAPEGVLQGSRADLFFGRRRLEVVQDANVAAHGHLHPIPYWNATSLPCATYADRVTATGPVVNFVAASPYQTIPLVSAFSAASGRRAALGTVAVPVEESQLHVVAAYP